MKKRKLKKILPLGIAALCAIALLQVIIVFSTSASSNDVSNSDVSASQLRILEEATTGNLQEVIISNNGDFSISEVAPPYNGNYRSELDDLGKEIYDLFAENYSDSKSNDYFEAVLENKVSFKAKVQNNQLIADEEYETARQKFITSFQTASIAFMYDNPDLFWIGSFGVNYWISYDSSTGTAYIEEVLFAPFEYYEGAYSEVAAFNSGVNSAIGSIVSELPTDADRYDAVKEIHDYICENASYDYTAAEIGGIDYSYAHTAAPLFVRENKTFVCEGYAKAFKVLCDRFNIPTVLVAGYGVTSSGSGGHMWNYAKMEDGNWYAVDATWNDQESYIYDTYLLIGSNTMVFNGSLFKEDHIADGNFTINPTMEFTFPPLSNEAYVRSTTTCGHTAADTQLQNAVASTCKNYGYTGDTICILCNTTWKSGVNTPKIPHTFSNYQSNNDATCTRDGTNTAKCENCDKISTIKDEGSRAPHSFTNYYSDNNATCKADGTKTAWCDNFDCFETDTIIDEDSRLPHTVKYYTSNKDATCTADGTKTGKCTKCYTPVTVTDEGSMLPHKFTNYLSDNNATCKADGTKTSKCNNCDVTDTIVDEGSALPHKYGAWSKMNEEYHQHTCTECSYIDTEPHEGGNASYSQKAECSLCFEEYGDLLAAQIKLNISEITMVKGQSFNTAVFKYPPESTGTIAWTSSDENIATVDNNGKITSVAKGKATITATMEGGHTATVKVTTVDSVRRPTTSITINKSTFTLTIKRSQMTPATSLYATIKGDSTGKMWFSDNINVATVNKYGRITAVSEGTANIYCRTADGTTSAASKITVNNYRIDSDNMRENIIYVNAGENCKIKLNSTVNVGAVTWKSSNVRYAEIDANGYVTALKKGTVTITASTADRNKDTCKLIIVQPSDDITIKSAKASVYVDRTVSLRATLSTRGSNDPIFWTSSNTSIATVTSKGVVKGLRQGTVTITATTFNGKKVSALVTVMTRATQIEFTKITPALYMGGNTGTFSVDVTSPTASNDTITWTTSNKRVIEIKKVSKDGRTITIKSGNKGTATITARSGSGKRITYKVSSVNQAATSVKLNKYSADIYVGQTVSLKASKIEPWGCNDVIIWKSLDESIATVTPDGLVKGVGQGVVTIEANLFGGIKQTVIINVKTRATALKFTKTTSAIFTNGNLETFTVEITAPENCNDTIAWSTSNKRVIEIIETSADGKTITIKSGVKGTATITARSGSGKRITHKVTVVNMPASNVTLNKTYAEIYVGQTVSLRATKITPSGCNDIVIWKSLDESIATVNANGQVKGISQGDVTIDATTFGGCENKITIKVRSKATSINVDKPTDTIAVGGSTTLNISEIAPANCNDKITWSTSSKYVATVTPSDDGKSATVYGIRKGTATITVRTGSGKYKQIKIVVTQ